MTDMTNEPQSSQAGDATTDVTTMDAASTDATERFRQGDNVRDLYEQMRPDQRTAMAGEFIRLLGLANDPQAEQFRQQFQRHTQIAAVEKDELLSADEVAKVDSYVREKHPEMIEQLLRHPVTESALKMPGARSHGEEHVPANAAKIMPTENVATSGAAYDSAWMMMELGGEESNRLVEDPHEGAVTSEGEREQEQRAFEDGGEDGEGSA